MRIEFAKAESVFLYFIRAENNNIEARKIIVLFYEENDGRFIPIGGKNSVKE